MYEQNRAFHYAVLASIVLHGMLLFGISQRQRPQVLEEPMIPIIARIVEPAAPPVATPAREEPVKLPAAEKPKPRAKPAAPKPMAKAPQPMSEPQVAAEPAFEEEVKAEAPPAPPQVTARVDPVPPAAAPAAPAQSAPAQVTPEIGTLAQYRLQLISAARNFKRYPRVAMDNNWEGDVVVRMAVGANGRLAALTIRSSSGHPVLDQQALEMFRKASAVVQVPPALRGSEFALELRAIYSLKDQDSG